MKLNCIIMEEPDLANVRREIDKIQRIVRTATSELAVRIRTRAPKKSGDLIEGIIPSPWEENSAYPWKIVRQVYMNAGMNDTFVKVTKNGKRYYYPASQEFGFRISQRSTLTPRQSAVYRASLRQERVPGKFFLNDTFLEYIPVFEEDTSRLVDKVVAR